MNGYSGSAEDIPSFQPFFYVGTLSTDLSEYSSFGVLKREGYSSKSRNRCLVSKYIIILYLLQEKVSRLYKGF